MPTIAEIRDQFPQYQDMSDGDLAEALRVKFYSDMPQADFLQRVGLAPARTGGGSAGARGIDEAQGSLYSAVEGVGRASGIAGLERFGREGRIRNEAEAQASLPDSQRMSFEQAQSAGDYTRAGLQALGLSLPSSAGPLAGAAAGAALGSVVPGIGTGLGALAGGFATSIPQFFGANRQRQIQETGEVQSEGRAFLAALPQAAVESIADRLTLGLGRVLGLGADTVGRAVIPRIARGIGMGAASEVPTEVLQQALERGQAGLDVFSPDAMKEYKEAAIAAGVLGGTIGGTAAGAFGRRPEAPGEDQAKRDAELLAALEALRVPGALEGASEEDLRASARAAMLPNWETATAETLRGQLGRLLDQHNPSPDQTDEQRNTTRNMERDDLAAVRADEVETEERRRLAQRLIGARADNMTLDQLRRVTRAGTDGDLLTTAPSAAGQTDDQRDTVRNQEVYARQAAAAEAEERAGLIAAVRGLRGSSISKERLDRLSLEDLRRMVGVGGQTTPPTTTAPQGETPKVETPPGQTPLFAPSSDWQVVPKDAVLPPGLEIRMNLETGVQEARLPPGTPQAEAPQAETPGTTPGGATVTNTQLQEMLDRIKELEATQSDAPPGAKPAQGLHSYDPATIGVDADTFQFKAGGDEHGVTDRLAGVRQWDPLKAGTALIYEYADGRRMIADGHQRLGLAKRLQAEGQQGIGLNAAVLREADGYSPADARALAAAKNISEGTGSALDAAKVIRDVGEDSDIIKNLPPNSSMVRDAKGLAKLSPMAFGFVVNDLVPQGFAAQVGKHVSNPDRQVEVLEEMHRNPPGNALEAELMAKQVNSLLQETEYAAAQGGLFGGAGGTGQTRSLLIAERAKVLANAIATIRQNKQLFNTAIRGSKTLTRAGNTLDEDANRQLKSEGDRLLAYLEANANAKGPVSDALSQAARGYAENRSSRTLASVRDAFVASATEALHRESNGVRDVPGGTGQANPGRSAADGRGAELPASATADTSQEVEAPAARIDDPNQGGFFSSREGGVTATEGTVSADAAKASQVVADRLAALRKMGKQGQAAAAAVEAALASGKFSPQQLLAAFRLAESAARILGNRQLEVRFVPQILHNGIERQGQLAALSPDGTEGLMQFSLSPSSLAFARETGAHEAFHVAQALFAASDPKLLAALKAAFPEGGGLKGIDATLIRKLQTLRPRDSRRSYWDQLAADPAIRNEASSIELQAYVFGALDDAKRNGQSLVGVKPALLRFANFLAELRQRLGAALKGDGFRSVGDVLSDVSGGTQLAGLSRAADIGQPFSSRGPAWPSPTTSTSSQAGPSPSADASRTPTPAWSGTAPSSSVPATASSISPTTSSATPAPGRSSSQTTGGLPLFDNQARLDFGRQGFNPSAVKQIGGIEARVVGPISEMFFRIAEGAMLTLPHKVRQALRDAGVKVALGQKFADWDPVMARETPRGWTPGSTWAEAEGAYNVDTREILAFETLYQRTTGRQVATDRPAGLVRHEAGHAFDHAMNFPSQTNQAFYKAWIGDLARLPPGLRMADPYNNPLYYYVANSAGQLASRSESFAELTATAVASGRAGPNDIGPLGGSYRMNLADHLPLSANVLRDLARDQNQKTDGRGQGLLFSSRTLAEPLKQEFSSADTSVKQLAATFRGVDWQPGTRNFDLGGGKYDLGTDYLREQGVENLVYDPFNRSDAHNERVLAATAETAADTATVNNVLNVIKEPEVRSGVIKMAAQSVKDDGTAYFLIYEGDRKGAGKQTSKGWQNNMPAAQYLDEVRAHFDDVTRKGNMIVARDPSLGTRLFSSRSRPADLAGDAAISKAYDATKGPGATPPRWYTKAMMGITGALPGESYKDALYRNSVNRAAPLYILDEMKKAQGVPDSRALGRMADRAFNATGRLEMVLEHGFIGYDAKSDRTFVRSDTPSVLGAFVGPDPKAPRVREAETDDFQNYLAMLRERDLLKSGRSGFKRLKPADVHAAIAAMESKRPAWKDAAADLHKINKAALEFGVATGILDPVKAKELAAIFYTPFYRQAEAEALSETAQGTTGPVTSSSLNNPHAFEKTVHESDSPIGNLFENLVKNYDFILRSGEKNIVLRATAEGMEKITNAAGEKLAERINYRHDGDKQVINLKIGGQSVLYKLHPKDPTAAATFLALVGMPTPVRGALFNAAAALAGVFRTGVTSLPSYMMANLWRGKIVAYAQEGLPFHTNTLQGMKQVYQASTSLKDFAAETGFGGFTFGMGEKNVTGALSRKLRTEGGDATLWDRMSNLVAHLQKLSESTELADRLKLQERLIAQGKSVGEAAHQAYLLAPYSRKGLGDGLVGGTLMALTPLVPFLNSKVQGVARMFENDNQKRRIAGVPADIFLRGLMLSAFSISAYALASQEPEWEDETPDRKLMYDIFYTPAGRIYLPRPFEFGTFFGALPVFMLDALRSQQGAQDLHKGAIQALLSTFGFNPIPQAVQPLLEVAFNYDSFRMRPLESQGMEQLPVAERKTEQTSTVAKVLSRGISAVDEAVMPQGSRLEISPVKAQRLIEGYTGSIGTMMLAAIDGLLGAVGAIPEKPGGVFGSPSSPTGMAATIAGVGRFFRADEEFTSRFVGDFYTAKRTADQIHKSFTEALLIGDRDKAQRIVAENRPALAARSMMEGVERQLSLLSQQMRAVAERDDMTLDQRREVLARYRQMRNDLSKRAVQAAQAVQ